MTIEELRELDVFCAEHVMMWKRGASWRSIEKGVFALHPSEGVMIHHQGNHIKVFRPTINHADALLVLEKCIKRNSTIHISERMPGKFCVYNEIGGLIIGEADTLPLAVAKFAKQLFSS